MRVRFPIPKGMPWMDRQDMFQKETRESFQAILESMKHWSGMDTTGPNFKETPDRVARAYGEILGGIFDNGLAIKIILSKTFPAKVSEMITVGPIEVWSMCPHHLLPVFMKVWVGYIPKKKVLGLSKLARLAELVAKKPALQEDTTVEIASILYKGLEPKGAACVIKGKHLCMEMRGVKKAAVTTTTALEGIFFKQEVRAEFLAGVRGDKG